MLSLGHQGYKNMVNYFNVQKAGNIDGNTMLKEHLSKTQKVSQNYQMMMIGAQCEQEAQHIRNIQMQAALDFEFYNNDQEFYKDIDFVRKMSSNNIVGQHEIKDQIQSRVKQISELSASNSKLGKENKVSVLIRNIHNHSLFTEIEPPFFESVSFVKFSPSGRYLLIANENCQYFYVYEILPPTSLRVQGSGGPNNMSIGFLPRDKQEVVRLQYYLFRGYTSAMVTDVQFVSVSNVHQDLEQLIVINTSNNTSHIFNLNKAQEQNSSPVIRSTDYDSGGYNLIKKNFFQQQMQQMQVRNVEAEVRFRYGEAARVSGQADQVD